jgi:hypothetical protein
MTSKVDACGDREKAISKINFKDGLRDEAMSNNQEILRAHFNHRVVIL